MFSTGTLGPATKEGYSPNGRCYKIVYVILSLEKVTSEMYKLMMFSTMTSLFFPSKPEYLILFYLRDNLETLSGQAGSASTSSLPPSTMKVTLY